MSAVHGICRARRRARFTCVAIVLGAAEPVLAPPGGAGNGGGNGGGAPAIQVTGVVRDFLADHPDFDVVPPEGYGQYMWNIATTLGSGDQPVYVGGGAKVLTQAHDADGLPICWTAYDPALGDTPAVADSPDTGSITSNLTFKQWFRDIPGINMSTLVTVTGTLAQGGPYAGMYEVNVSQFYPIDGLLLGNEGEDHNHFFTFEIAAEFTHDSSAGYKLYFLSDDDAWVFLNGKLVADLGGINGSTEQWVHLDRLGLQNGVTYRIYFFKADRSDASSRFHLVTNIPLTTALVPTLLAQFD